LIVTIGGQSYDPNTQSGQAGLFAAGYQYFQGQWLPVDQIARAAGENYVVEPAAQTPTPWVSPAITSLTGGVGSAQPGVMVNQIVSQSVLAGAWTGFNPGDLAGGLAILRSYSASTYGSADLGVVRRSSEVLENEPSGIRPGTLERIVIPVWARRERGSPI